MAQDGHRLKSEALLTIEKERHIVELKSATEMGTTAQTALDHTLSIPVTQDSSDSPDDVSSSTRSTKGESSQSSQSSQSSKGGRPPSPPPLPVQRVPPLVALVAAGPSHTQNLWRVAMDEGGERPVEPFVLCSGKAYLEQGRHHVTGQSTVIHSFGDVKGATVHSPMVVKNNEICSFTSLGFKVSRQSATDQQTYTMEVVMDEETQRMMWEVSGSSLPSDRGVRDEFRCVRTPYELGIQQTPYIDALKKLCRHHESTCISNRVSMGVSIGVPMGVSLAGHPLLLMGRFAGVSLLKTVRPFGTQTLSCLVRRS